MTDIRSCACGCGGQTRYKFLRGHASRLRARDGSGNKRCPECGIWKPATVEFFQACKGRINGITSLCRPCHIATGTRNRQLLMERDENARERIRLKWRERRFKRRLENPQRDIDIKHRSAQKLRRQLVDAYGGRCSCCGEMELPFLTLEHTNGDGKAHRLRVGEGERVWLDLKKRGWPQEGYTILCWNCHMATTHGRICPHKNAVTLDAT